MKALLVALLTFTSLASFALPVDLQPGQNFSIDYNTLSSYGGRVEVYCGGGYRPNPPPPPPSYPGPGRPGRPDRPGHGGGGYRQQTIYLDGASCGNGQGYCDCVTPGRADTPDRNKAEQICRDYGYNTLVTYDSGRGVKGALQCGGLNGACYRNQAAGNLICTSVTCAR